MPDDASQSTVIDDVLADQAQPLIDDVDDDDTDGTAAPTKRQRKKRNALLEWLIVIAIAMTSALLMKTYLVEQFLVEGSSMLSTLHDGDRVLVNKLSYRLHDPNRGDVVVLKRDEGSSTERDLIKRVIALPGEVVEVRECRVYIDGRLLEEPYLDPDVVTPIDCGGSYPPTTVPDDHVFVMGDNRGHSGDGRSFGPTPYDEIIGRAFVVIWPTADWQWL